MLCALVVRAAPSRPFVGAALAAAAFLGLGAVCLLDTMAVDDVKQTVLKSEKKRDKKNKKDKKESKEKEEAAEGGDMSEDSLSSTPPAPPPTKALRAGEAEAAAAASSGGSGHVTMEQFNSGIQRIMEQFGSLQLMVTQTVQQEVAPVAQKVDAVNDRLAAVEARVGELEKVKPNPSAGNGNVSSFYGVNAWPAASSGGGPLGLPPTLLRLALPLGDPLLV